MAGRIPESVVDDILSRVSITDVIGEYVRLQRKGARLLGLCPFHNEKSPSFSVSPDKGLFYCFGCGASGTTVSFLMQHDGLSFPEALRKLADRVGVTIPETGGEDPAVAARRRSARDRYFEVTDFAVGLYERALWSGRFTEALAYLESRGIDEETARSFRLGFAPPEWSALLDAARSRGFTPADIEAAGLAIRKDNGGHYDRFRNRVMFPVVNLSRKVLAFSGRTLDPEERAKYINSPETAFYTKGRELFGLVNAQRAVREQGYVVLVEGNFDVVSLHARGITMACAALGTALTDQQARLLRRFTDRVVLAFDGDNAGRKAADKALEILLDAETPDVATIDLPDGSDPDDFVRKNGGEALQTLIDDASPMLRRAIDAILAPAAGSTDPSLKRHAVDQVADLLSHVRDPLVWRTWVSEIAQRLQIDEPRLGQYVRKPSESRHAATAEAAAATTPAVMEPLPIYERQLVEAIALDSALLGQVHREQIHHVIDHVGLGDFLERVARAWEEEAGPGLREAILALEDEDPLRRMLLSALAQDPTLGTAQVDLAFQDTISRMKQRWARREKKRVTAAIRLADERGDLAPELYRRSLELDRLLHEIDRSLKSVVES